MAEPLKVALLAMNAPGYQSLALGYLRAFAESDPQLKGRVAFQSLDLEADYEPWWVAYRLIGMRPDVLAASVLCWNARAVFDVCRIVKQALPDVRVILGGPEVGPIAESVLAEHTYVDAVVRGEGEETFAELLDVLRRDKPLTRVDGVTARDRDGVPRSSADRPLIGDLDRIPSPYLSGALTPKSGRAYIEGFRGCPHRCAYCFEGKGYGRIRSFSKERVEAEIRFLVEECGVTSLSFIDPVFNLTAERLGWLADALERHVQAGLRLHTIEVDIERVDDTVAEQLKRAGVVSVETGPQSVGAAALEACHRPFDRERFARGVAACKQQGIRVECDIIAGLPGDTIDDFFAGIGFCLSLDPGIIQTSTLHVLPGTELWSQAEEIGLRFDPLPPHEVIETRSFSFADLRRAEARSLHLARIYAARLTGV